MKAKIFALVILAGFFCKAGLTNPLPEPLIMEYSVDPPWIEVMYATDLTGETIRTTGGSAIITSFIPNQDYLVLLDSSNTTGFTLNPEGDSIIISGLPSNEIVAYGNLGPRGVPPLPGESAIGGVYEDSIWFYYAYDFCAVPSPGDFNSDLHAGAAWGSSGLIINEINLHCTWQENAGFIELYNRSSEPVDLSDKYLIGDARLAFDENTVVEPGSFLVIDEIDFPTGFDSNYPNDNLYLVVETWAGKYCVIDQVGWSTDHGENVSFMRYPDGDVDPSVPEDFMGYNDQTSYTFENGFPSRGAPNRHQSPGFVVIGARADSAGDGAVYIHWTDPIWQADFSESILRKSTAGFPETPFDGELIYEGADQQFLDEAVVPDVMTYYTVFARDNCGQYSIPTDESQASIILEGVGIHDGNIPEHHTLLTCYPNPFNAQTKIMFSIENESYVRISVYDVAGRLVNIIASEIFPAGKNSVTWHANNLPSGVYFYSIKTDQLTLTRKAVLLK